MTSMTQDTAVVIGGVDCHAEFHQVAAIDAQGRLLGTSFFTATERGYQHLLEWLRGHGQLREVGVESTGAYGAGLARYLTAAGVPVVEVNQPHAHTRARRGKTDAIDAEAAARKVLAGETTSVAKDTTGAVEAIRHLHVVRASAVKARSAALHQLSSLLVTAPAELREQVTAKTLKGKVRACLDLLPDPAKMHTPLEAAKHALSTLARRIRDLDGEIADLEAQLQTLVAGAAPRTTRLLGVGTIHAAQLLITAGQNVTRLRDEASFAHLCAADPVPASSGKTLRHRLNPGGDRAANRALHLIVVVRLRYCERTRAYADRRTTEGLSKKEIIRCLKRYIAREIYHALRADLTALQPA